MSQAAVQLKVAGQVYRVVTSAPEDELLRLASRVEDALAQVTAPGRQPSPQAFVLAALTLAHELEEERERVRQLEERHKALLQNVLERVERALGDEAEPALARASARSQSSSRRESR
jgi:cell division protein ZapA